MSDKKSRRARTMGEEILDAGKAGGDGPQTPETPLTGASKASTPPRPATKAPAPKRSRVTEAEEPRRSGLSPR